MAEIKKEYPEGKAVLEMVLVKMLNERRSWADYQAIGQALWNIRFHADQMKKEQEYLSSDSNEIGQAQKPPGENDEHKL